MKWLVTVDESVDLEALAQRLRAVGCDWIDIDFPIPLSAGEVAISVEGSTKLPQLVADDPTIKKVYNDSDITLA